MLTKKKTKFVHLLRRVNPGVHPVYMNIQNVKNVTTAQHVTINNYHVANRYVNSYGI